MIPPYGQTKKSVNSDMVVLPARESARLLRWEGAKTGPGRVPEWRCQVRVFLGGVGARSRGRLPARWSWCWCRALLVPDCPNGAHW